MRSWITSYFVLCLFGLHGLVNAQQGLKCDLSKKKADSPFPDLEKEGVFSFHISAEFTAPNAEQTDYYNEYYDILERRGRVDSNVKGSTTKYYYRTETQEAFTIKDRDCTLSNVSDIPEFMKDDPIEWLYDTGDISLQKKGPSAMFQTALDVWKNKKDNTKMAYMGMSPDTVRGMNAQYWRRCISDNYFVDYYFTTDDHEDVYGFNDLKRIPLRVVFRGVNPDDDQKMLPQEYNIMGFQPFISDEKATFQLPMGYGCRRGDLVDAPDLPDFTGKNLQFSSEVVYRIISKDQLWSYYSVLFMSLDLESQHLAYFNTPWSQAKPSKEGEEPEVAAPEFDLFDIKHGYKYHINWEKNECSISREKSFTPKYSLPNNGGYIDLTDPSIIFTNDELSYVSDGKDRGMDVSIFEGTFENYDLKSRKVSKAIVSHSYLKDNEVERNRVSVKNALTKIQLRMRDTGKPNFELLTFNLFGLTTQLLYKRFIFDVTKCFKNEEDYIWITIGFPIDPEQISKVKDDTLTIQRDVMENIKLKTELNEIRIPTINVIFSDQLYVTFLVLEKPPILLDYMLPEEKGKTIKDTVDAESILTMEDCANMCVESKDNCWGFSICGATCYFGTSLSPAASVGPKEDCTLYRRYNNETYIPSLEMVTNSLKSVVGEHEMRLMLRDKDDNVINLEANFIEVTNPGEEDEMFERMGNELNPRMKVRKIASKLKGKDTDNIKNLGSLRYEECQRLCLDFKDCETMSYCIDNSECILSKKYGDEIGDDSIESKNTCNLLSRKYADNFKRSPGNVLSLSAKKILDIQSAEDCARACLKETEFKCLSFDHCANAGKEACKLHTVIYTDSQTKESQFSKNTNCGHYFRKFSAQFKKYEGKRSIGITTPLLMNITLEECAKACIDYGKGTCFGYDFCQALTMFATSCALLDKLPGDYKTSYSPVCNNYQRDGVAYSDTSYSNSMAAGIGILCFVIGGVVGAAIVFVIAYIRMNKK